MLNCFLELQPTPLHTPVKVNMILLIRLGNANALLQPREHRHCQIARNDGSILGTAGRVRWSTNTVLEPWREHNPACSKPRLCCWAAASPPNAAFQRAEGLFAVETLNQYTGTKESSNANRSSIQTWNPGNILLASKTPSVTHSPMKRAVSEVIFIYNVFVPCLFGKWRTSWSRWHLS